MSAIKASGLSSVDIVTSELALKSSQYELEKLRKAQIAKAREVAKVSLLPNVSRG